MEKYWRRIFCLNGKEFPIIYEETFLGLFIILQEASSGFSLRSKWHGRFCDTVIKRTGCVSRHILFFALYLLLLTDVDIYRSTREVPALADLVFQEALVGFLDILRQVGEEYERGHACARELHAVLDLDVLTLV